MPNDINRVQKRFREWRANRGSVRSKTPIELIEAALALARRHGDKRVLEALELSAGSLWNWRQAKVKSRKLNETGDEPEKIRFVEIKPASQGVAGSLRIELARGNGQLMRVEGLSVPEVREVAEFFLSVRGGEL